MGGADKNKKGSGQATSVVQSKYVVPKDQRGSLDASNSSSPTATAVGDIETHVLFPHVNGVIEMFFLCNCFSRALA
jgi:hypothetical protein